MGERSGRLKQRLNQLVEGVSDKVSSVSLPPIINREGDDFYQSLRKRLSGIAAEVGPTDRIAGVIMAGPDLVHLNVRLILDPRVSRGDKIRMAAVLAYFVTPLDIIPEIILGPLGWLDNVALLAYALHTVVNNTGPEIVQEHWAGDEDVLDLIGRVLSTANELVTNRVADGVEKLIGKPVDKISKMREETDGPPEDKEEG